MTADLPLPAVLARIDAWYKLHVPAIHATLRPGVTQAALDDLERELGFRLPDAFRTLYAWHDGQDWKVGGLFGLEFMPLSMILATWREWQRGEDMGYRDAIVPPGSTQDVEYTRGWLGFLRSHTYTDYIALDFEPGTTGLFGQVINFGFDQGTRYVVSNSLEEFLFQYWTRLSAGRATVAHTLDHADVEEEHDRPAWYVGLHDGRGRVLDEYRVRVLAHLYPGFGAVPEYLDPWTR